MECTLNKAVYRPSETVRCAITGIPAGAATLRVSLLHLTDTVASQALPVAGPDGSADLPLPGNDYIGYLLRAEALDSGASVLAAAFNAVDCSSDWTRFPRYGYLWDFTASADAEGKLARLARYHLNGLQFYDWQYRHHIPVAPDVSGWKDWSGREIDGGVLTRCIAAAHARGINCLGYNMVYAANRTYLTDGSGVAPAWRLRRENGEDFTCDMDASLGDVGVLQYFNILDPGWQRYLFARENEVFRAFAFDGWHGDTIGECGPMTDARGGPLGYAENGEPIYRVKDGYTAFLNAAKKAIGSKYLVFNPVGAQGMENVNASAVDVLYAEFWPWEKDASGQPYDRYAPLRRAVLDARAQSGGKSLVAAAYVNYKNASERFNAPAVRLLDCVLFASGGAHIELGNGDGMLSNEYFPDDRHKRMDEPLRLAVIRLYDFAVAYQNLLRDGPAPVERRAEIEGVPVSRDGRADAVWCFAAADERYETHHFINLTGTDGDWRDTEQTKAAPTPLSGLRTKLYPGGPVEAVCLASPDENDLSARNLPFAAGRDGGGGYVTFTMPTLFYWNMIFLRIGRMNE